MDKDFFQQGFMAEIIISTQIMLMARDGEIPVALPKLMKGIERGVCRGPGSVVLVAHKLITSR